MGKVVEMVEEKEKEGEVVMVKTEGKMEDLVNLEDLMAGLVLKAVTEDLRELVAMEAYVAERVETVVE